MKIAVIDDYQNAFKTLKCFPKLAGHDVVVYSDTANDVASLVAKLKDADVAVFTQQRSFIPRAVIEQLPKLTLIGQTGRAAAHIDLTG
jgi:D-3-phosphoglycerate dehydrogenase